MKNICFYHDDADGRMSAAIVKDAIPDCELVEIDYGYDEKVFYQNCIINKRYSKIIIVDFSFETNTMLDLNAKCEEMIWCDHHKSAMEKYEDLWNDKNVKGLRSLNKSGCRLTWEYFHPHIEVPYSVLLIEDMDLWKFEHGERTKALAEALYFETDITKYQAMIHSMNYLEGTYTKGHILLEHKWKRVEKASYRGYFIEWEGYKTYVVNTPEDISTLGNYVCNNIEIDADIGLIFYEI